jgi:hypothetical protein
MKRPLHQQLFNSPFKLPAMKFTLFSLVALACASSALATPSPVAAEDSVILKKAAIGTYAAEARNIDERAAASVTGTVTASALKYHTCSKTSCAAVGQFPVGTKITIICRTDTSTTVVEGWP